MNKNRHRVVLSKSRRSDSRLVSQEKGWGGAQLSAYSQKRAGRGCREGHDPCSACKPLYCAQLRFLANQKAAQPSQNADATLLELRTHGAFFFGLAMPLAR